jgi:phosphoglycolate phosphatase
VPPLRGAPPLTSSPAATLVLWDVDLTLVHAGPAGRELYADAFERLTGLPMRALAPRAGRLDTDIFRDTIEAHDLDPAGYPFARFAEVLASVYASRSGLLRQLGSALPGAADALAALAGDPMVVQTVLTGNVRPAAAAKLAAFDLDRYLDLDIGAYGADAATRAGLVALARRRAGSRHGIAFDAGSTVIVGDSGHDVVAGRDGGAFVIAVATGLEDAASLRRAGADVVLPDLGDTAMLLRAIATRGGPPAR